jgi:hypothetical protein
MRHTGKKTVSFRVDPDVWDQFKALVTQKYDPEVFGGISVELESMLKNWLAAHTNLTNSPARLNPVGSPSERYARKIVEWLLTKTDTFQVPRALIVKAIEECRGADRRTIKKWFCYLHKHGHIKPLHGEIWEVV